MNNKLNILIVDDEPDIVEFLSYNLTKSNYKVYKALNGIQGLHEIKEHHQDLILLDVRMPEMNGLEFCREVRKYDEYRYTPILFLSADRSEFTEKNALEAGGSFYINKPIQPSRLLEIINQFLHV